MDWTGQVKHKYKKKNLLDFYSAWKAFSSLIALINWVACTRCNLFFFFIIEESKIVQIKDQILDPYFVK